MKSPHGPLRIGIGGPVGAGKTSLTAALCSAFKDKYSVAAITNDIYTQEDAEALMRMQILPKDRILGVETGGCPHTAIREDASINLAAIETLGPAITRSDILVINKTDLAPHVGASLDVMKRDAKMMRGKRPVVFAAIRHSEGIQDIEQTITQIGGLE